MVKLVSFKKTTISMFMALALVLLLALPASAAAYSVQFVNSSGAVSTHATSFIDGGAVDVTGTAGNYTVVVKLKNFDPSFPLLPVSYPSLTLDLNGGPTGDGVYEVSASKTVSGSYTYFTFSGVSNVTSNIPLQLAVNVAGIHSTTYSLFLDWL